MIITICVQSGIPFPNPGVLSCGCPDACRKDVNTYTCHYYIMFPEFFLCGEHYRYLCAWAENLFVAHICLRSLRGLPARVLKLIIHVHCTVNRLTLIHHEQIN
jgi:hypothetical protein